MKMTECWQIHLCFRSDIDTLQFQLTFEIPHIRVKAQYRSSGVLILVKASGSGEYWGEYGKRNQLILYLSASTNSFWNWKPVKINRCVKKIQLKCFSLFSFQLLAYRWRSCKGLFQSRTSRSNRWFNLFACGGSQNGFQCEEHWNGRW